LNYQFTLFCGVSYNRRMKTELNQLKLTSQNAAAHLLGLCLMSAAMVPVWIGCSPEAQRTADTNPAGVYTLASVDEKTVPCGLTHDGTTITIKSGVFTIETNGACRSLITFTVPSQGDMSREVKATYTRQGSELTLQWEGAGMTRGNLKGNQFTMTNEGMVFSYRK
jgi:hypothetical protein